MTYSPMGALSSSDWKETGSGSSMTCKPANFTALAAFKELQSQANRVAQMKGYKKIAVDGDLGPGTAALVNQILGMSVTCHFIAANIDGITAGVKHVADTYNAPAAVSPATTSTTSGGTSTGAVTTPYGPVTPPPDAGAPGGGALASLSAMSSTTKLALGAGLVLLAALAGRELKGGPRRSTRRSRPVRRRRTTTRRRRARGRSRR